MYIQQKLLEAERIIHSLENSSGNGTEEELNLLDDLQKIIGENPILIKYQSIILYNAGFTEDAINYLISGLQRFPKSYELYTLTFELIRFSGDKKTVFYILSQMYKQAPDEDTINEVLKKLEDYVLSITITKDELSELMDYFRTEISTGDYRAYPIDEYGNSILRKDVFSGRDPGNSYLANIYKSSFAFNVNNNGREYFLFELIKGIFTGKKAELSVKEGDIVAVSYANPGSEYTNLTLHNLETEPYQLRMEPNNIKYFRIKKSDNVIIEADQDIFVSHFKNNVLKDKPKLVLQIFVDGLSFKFVKDNGFEQLMPNTYEFFKSGYINSNCHCSGEWTLPSLLGMSSGKYTSNHYVYHTNVPHKVEELNKLIQEYFSEAGYMTGRVCPNWRGTPSYGYFKSTNRSVYSRMQERMLCNESVTEALEHLEVFKDFYNHLWLTVEDLHTVADGLTRGALADINIENYVTETVSNDSEISVFRSYNRKKIEEYKSMIKKVDFYLGILFDYVKRNYKEDEYIIMLNSDHGQRFIEEDSFMFAHKRTNVPFMMRGRNVPNMNSEELMSNVDILPTLLNLCGLSCDQVIDGRLLKDFGGEEREYAITESIFPGQTYKLAINDRDHLFGLETKEFTRYDGLIPIQDYQVWLKNKLTGEDETEKYPDKVEHYTEIAFEHIKEWIAF